MHQRKHTIKTFLSLLAFIGFTYSSMLFSAVADEKYAFVDIGNSSYEIESESVSATGWRIGAGYFFNESLSFEAMWISQGEKSESYVDGEGSGKETISLEGIQLAISGTKTFTNSLDVFARVGLYFWEASYRDVYNGSLWASADDDGNDIFFGAGVRYPMTNALSAIFSYDIISIDIEGISADANRWALGASYNFQ